MPLIRSISGLRATLPDSLKPEIIRDYTAAFLEMLPPGAVLIGRDGRQSGKWIEDLIAETICSGSRNCYILGIVPTPTVQLMVELYNAAGGIAITASHNPSEWNGLKFINSEGIFLDAVENGLLWKILDEKKFVTSEPIELKPNIISDAIERHIEKLLSLPVFSDRLKMGKLNQRRFKVVVDAVNSSGSVAIPSLLAKLGCEVHPLYCDSSGIFPHNPEPVPRHLSALSDAVITSGADIGIAVDPDADRLVLIDETGYPIGEEKTIALAIESVLSGKQHYTTQANPCVVVNDSTSRMAEDIAAKHSATVFRSAVGEINVVKLMKETNAIAGGEGSGGVILPACHYGRDSLAGTALILFYLASNDLSLSQASKLMPAYTMVKLKKGFTGSLSNVISRISHFFPGGIISYRDGIKVDFPDSWVQLRASNTEPIIRIIAEAQTESQARNLAETVMDMVK